MKDAFQKKVQNERRDRRAARNAQPGLPPTLPPFILHPLHSKNAALLALIGTILMTALLAWKFVLTLLYAFGCLSVRKALGRPYDITGWFAAYSVAAAMRSCQPLR
jgi:hypothetical protein